MFRIFEEFDKTERKIYLTVERWKHIQKHSEMSDKLEEIKDVLAKPLKITDYLFEKDVKHYYKYYKDRKSKAKYLRVIVKYLNGEGFVITAYFVDKIK